MMKVRSHRLDPRTLGVVVAFLLLLYLLSFVQVFFADRSLKRRFASEENGAFWSKHFFYSQNVAWDDYALSLFLEYADRNVTRENVAVLSSLVDENRDGRVTLEENASFLIKFGGSRGKGRGKGRPSDDMYNAIAQALDMVEGDQSSQKFGGEGGSQPDSDSVKRTYGCSVKLEAANKQYVEVAASGNLQFRGDSPFTIEVWAKSAWLEQVGASRSDPKAIARSLTELGL